MAPENVTGRYANGDPPVNPVSTAAGGRIFPSAGAASFRRKPTLEQCLEEAHEQVEALRKELEAAPQASSRRQAAARRRAAEERRRRVAEALAQMPEAESKKKKAAADKDKARVSTTDADARVMKMADGDFARPTTVNFPWTRRRRSWWVWP